MNDGWSEDLRRDNERLKKEPEIQRDVVRSFKADGTLLSWCGGEGKEEGVNERSYNAEEKEGMMEGDGKGENDKKEEEDIKRKEEEDIKRKEEVNDRKKEEVNDRKKEEQSDRKKKKAERKKEEELRELRESVEEMQKKNDKLESDWMQAHAVERKKSEVIAEVQGQLACAQAQVDEVV